VQVEKQLSVGRARQILNTNPDYLLIGEDRDSRVLMPAAELAKFLQSADAADGVQEIDLLSIPANRLQVAVIQLQANLQEAQAMFRDSSAEALVVERMTAPGIQRVYGILLPETLEKSYQY
jgi:hypothetical protein